MREIGSEFWTQCNPTQIYKSDNEEYLLSGRTSLRFIIEDILKTRKVRNILLPSYCCESMIQPFYDFGMDVHFYQVDVDFFDYDYDNDADIVLLIDYFGYTNPQNVEIAYMEKKSGKVVIYDSTHMIDGNVGVQKFADYSFCSYRKWFYCNFSKAIKHNGVFNNNIELKSNDSYITIRNKAANTKYEYISGLINQKESFLSDFSAAEYMLERDYVGYSGVPVSFDIHDIISKRRENASYLIGELKTVSEIRLWCDSLKDQDTPMFVPILVDPSIRDDLRRKLINESIYCPVHWPKSSYHYCCNKLYDIELSLICDQRYDISNMKRIINIIKDYFNR